MINKKLYFSLYTSCLIISSCQSLSVPITKYDAKSIEKALKSNSDDVTTVPFDKIISSDNDFVFSEDIKLFYSSDFIPRQKLPDFNEYCKQNKRRHKDCLDLFDGYSTEILRCEPLPLLTQKETSTSVNIRWKASWIPAGSTWLYQLAESFDWKVEKRTPDPSKISTFSYKAIFDVFRGAFQTGIIKLPISSIEGNTILSILIDESVKNEKNNEVDSRMEISIKESIDLVNEADIGRLQNRRVAQELASWLDVSRRPDEIGTTIEEWASQVRSRIISTTPGAGILDVDPNAEEEDNNPVSTLFGGLVIAGFALAFNLFLSDQIVGGTGNISALCDDAARLEFGQGYLSECFGPYGDGPYIR